MSPSLLQIPQALKAAVNDVTLVQVNGKVTQVTGTLIRALAPGVRVGELCRLRRPDHEQELLAEVIGLQQDQALLAPLGDIQGLCTRTEVCPTGSQHRVGVGDHLLGMVLDGLGNTLDGSVQTAPQAWYPVHRDAPAPLSRKLVDTPLSLGIRCIDGLLTCAEGQRVGIFAPAGGGKSTLLASLLRNAQADVIVLALIGERGREVREFIHHELGEQGLRRAVLVVATSDRPAMERARAGFVATTVAEYFRDQGRKVLLLMDSLTRFARAQREIGLAAGEPPTRRGFPPSVFAQLPRLLERAGHADKGSITALYTVLVEGDDLNEPIAEETRSILDGHIVLSQALGAANHYPAIDVLRSVSRVMHQVVSPAHRAAASQLRQWMACYEEVELLLRVGEYTRGQDPAVDQAIDKRDAIRAWLCQAPHERSSLQQSLEQLLEIARCP
ncbi:type III secretion system ATPase SctN [Pseudomonas mosselii]|uniref:Type 3 secretion system ATPase n=1 Tax=Pseudomonas mosselii TaxID=78327 RepID=A0ABX9B5G4_9PSED|nr:MULTISPECIES: type III secretion system ATPase SctN [Pseudomonas]MBS9760554.1 type III secretion system ATPase SctN [Pseudomonas mosselii]MDH0630521.1 type III secretion system ATPase SctN [Pseudomonas mosselii]MDH0679041.1 type III secretion system ATPase SctN [Pseudomonas mosselii]MDH0926527.1 type III secretion system ATPase SctN [Pseudomonas mosselii]MDH1134485.1 type III secretion system ATPase SctN [Pseudomonas mosselii]